MAAASACVGCRMVARLAVQPIGVEHPSQRRSSLRSCEDCGGLGAAGPGDFAAQQQPGLAATWQQQTPPAERAAVPQQQTFRSRSGTRPKLLTHVASAGRAPETQVTTIKANESKKRAAGRIIQPNLFPDITTFSIFTSRRGKVKVAARWGSRRG